MDTFERWKAAPFDAVTWALKRRNRRAARAMLERRGALTWVEGSEYAPWTLGWAPDLLELILDLVPRDGEELFCLRRFLLPGGVWIADVCAGLLTAAAALNDLPAVELLLARGYQLEAHDLYCRASLSPHFCELGRIRSNTQFSRLNDVSLLPRVQSDQHPWYLSSLDFFCPLSAAIFCGAVRCTARLLEETGDYLSLSVRHALISARRDGQPTVQVVTGALGKELAELLEPEEFLDRTDPLFLQCLRLHGAEPEHRHLIRYLVSSAADSQKSLNALRCVDPGVLSGVLLELLEDKTQRLSARGLRDILSLPGLRPVLDRNAVPPSLEAESLMLYLDSAQVVGEPPQGELSGLAAALLRYALREKPQLWVHNHKLLSVLREEDPDMVLAYLHQCHRPSPHAVHLIRSLLNIHKEENYEL